MSSLSFVYISQCFAHERSPNIQYKVLTYPKAQLSFESQRNLQNLCGNVHVMRRKA